MGATRQPLVHRYRLFAILAAVGAALLLMPPAPGAPGQGPLRLDSLGALVAATGERVPAEEGFRLYSLRCDYPITILHFADETTMMRHLARVMCWFDIPDGRKHAAGSIEEARRAVAEALGPGNAVGAAQYTVQQVAETFTACCPATGPAPWSADEERLLSRLAAAGLIRRDGAKCEAPDPGSLVVVYGQNGAENLHHELNHALYAQAAGYREAVDQAWQERLTAAEREGIVRALGKMGYNTENARLMRSEFSAYSCTHPLPTGCRPEAIEWVRAREREFFPALLDERGLGRPARASAPARPIVSPPGAGQASPAPSPPGGRSAVPVASPPRISVPGGA